MNVKRLLDYKPFCLMLIWFFCGSFSKKHAYYVGIEKGYFDKNQHCIKASIYLDTEDLQTCLSKTFNKQTHLNKGIVSPKAQQLIHKYCQKHIQYWINKRLKTIKWGEIKCELDGRIKILYKVLVKRIKTLKHKNTLLMGCFVAQKNICQIEINPKQSYKSTFNRKKTSYEQTF